MHDINLRQDQVSPHTSRCDRLSIMEMGYQGCQLRSNIELNIRSLLRDIHKDENSFLKCPEKACRISEAR